MFSNKNSLWLGLLISICLPIMVYGILLTLYDQLEAMGAMSNGGRFSPDFRKRTLALVALCSNLIPFNIFRKRKWDEAMRGMVVPTMAYVIAWLWVFGRHLIG
jgi:hypothetical protein